MTYSGFNQCANECDKCYTDSGISWISLPLPAEFCETLPLTTFNRSDYRTVSMLIDLEGVNGNNVTLSLPLFWLAEQMDAEEKNVQCTGTSGAFVLGFPIFQYYYLVYDMGNNTVTFVDLQLSDETEDFIFTYDQANTGCLYPVSASASMMTVTGLLFMLYNKYIL